MRWGAVLLLGLTATALTGCTTGSSVPPATRTSAPAVSSPVATPAASLTADGAFETPIVCRAVVDYETVQAAIATGDLDRIHTVAAAAASDDAAGFASDEAHSWAPDVKPLIPAYLAKGVQQVQYFRAVATAKTVDDATSLTWPDGTDVSTPVFAAIGISDSLTCPKP